MSKERTILNQISYSNENKLVLSLHLRAVGMTYREKVKRSDEGDKILDMPRKENYVCFFPSEAHNAINTVPPVHVSYKKKVQLETTGESHLERQHNLCKTPRDFPMNTVLLFLSSNNFKNCIKIKSRALINVAYVTKFLQKKILNVWCLEITHHSHTVELKFIK